MKPVLKRAGIVVVSLTGLFVVAIAYVFIASQPNPTVMTNNRSGADIDRAIRQGLRTDG